MGNGEMLHNMINFQDAFEVQSRYLPHQKKKTKGPSLVCAGD